MNKIKKLIALTSTLLLFFGGIGRAAGSGFSGPASPKRILSNAKVRVSPPVTAYSINLTQQASHLYSSTENIQVSITTTSSGGGIENDIGASSQTVPQGTSTLSLGKVPGPGVYFTRYRVGSENFISTFLILPAGANKFTVEIIDAPVTAVELGAAKQPIAKFFANLTAARLQTAATSVAPAWFALNGQNFLVLAAKGIVLTYSGLGFIAIVAEKEIAANLLGLALDFTATVLARVADDLRQANVITVAERNTIKTAIAGINGIVQAGLANSSFERMINVAQGISDVVLGEDDDSKVLAKVVGDSIKKFHVFIKLAKP